MIPEKLRVNRRPVARLGGVFLSTLLASFMAVAQLAPAPAPVRVVTWNLLPRDKGTGIEDKTVAETARVLKELNPDVIVLEQVPDLLNCEDILQALKPSDYQVAVFSSFRDPQTGDLSRQQVAILSRAKASNPYWDTWQGDGPAAAAAPGGFASAVIHLENRNLGVFAVQLSDASTLDDHQRETVAQQAARESASRQLVQQLDALRDSTNAVQSLVVAGDFNTTPDDPKLSREMTLLRLEHAGFANALDGVPSAKRITLPGNGNHPDATLDYVFNRDAGHFANVQVLPATLTLHNPVAADLVFETPAAVAVVAATPTQPAAPASSGGTPPATEAPAAQPEAAPSVAAFWQTLVGQIGMENVWWLAGLLAGGVLFTMIGFRLLARRTRTATKMAVTGGLSRSGPGEVLIMAPAAQTGSATGLMPVVHIQGPAQMDTQAWKQRAEQAERRADQATDVVRRGLMGELSRWLRGGAARRLVSDRAQLLEAQRAATLKMQVVDERLTKVEQHIEQRTREYEKRIGELEAELVEAREENRELIREKIAQVRAEMERERARLLQHARANA
jgi:endonuclease/exonuclease/phosphatase family metal-dependent hydrolase